MLSRETLASPPPSPQQRHGGMPTAVWGPNLSTSHWPGFYRFSSCLTLAASPRQRGSPSRFSFSNREARDVVEGPCPWGHKELSSSASHHEHLMSRPAASGPRPSHLMTERFGNFQSQHPSRWISEFVLLCSISLIRVRFSEQLSLLSYL